jgi:hypothetical protein
MTGGALVSAAEALKAARAAGIRFAIDGEELVLDAPVQPAAAILDLVSRHTDGIMALLRPGGDGWSADDWQGFYDKRAGIAEFDGGLPRAEAEARAFACCLSEWQNRHPARSSPERCLACGGGEHCHDPLLPYGIESSGHAWLHSRCWPAWHDRRKAEAAAALAGMGIGRQP